MSSERITRRHLPHWYVPGAAHFVTWRLHGTLPAEVIDRLRARAEELRRQPPRAGESERSRRHRVHKQLFADYDDLLDAHREIRWLAEPRVAAVVRGNLYHHHGRLFHLLAYCVMPNHVHALFVPVGGQPEPEDRAAGVGEEPDGRSPLAQIMHSLKSYTAHRADEVLGRNGQFWQHESYDHWVRDEDELERITNYVCHNPVKAGLVERPEDWFFCSCHDRYLADGEASAWLRWDA